MGDEIYFAKETINRVSFLRDDPDFIIEALRFANTKLIFIHNSYPIVVASPSSAESSAVKSDGPESTKASSLDKYNAATQAVSGIKPQPTRPPPRLLTVQIAEVPELQDYLIQWAQLNKSESIEIRNYTNVVFLGLMENTNFTAISKQDPAAATGLSDSKETEAAPLSGSKETGVLSYRNKYIGVPYFIVDIKYPSALTLRVSLLANDKNNNNKVVKQSDDTTHAIDIFKLFKQHDIRYDVLSSRNAVFKIPNDDASLFSYGKMYIDWLNKQNFCPQCGSEVIKIHAGTKLLCTAAAAADDDDQDDKDTITKTTTTTTTSTVDGKDGKKPIKKVTYKCESKNLSVSNIQFPRIDPVCIIAVVNLQHNKILLANSLRFPDTTFYSCVAGFMEPGESIESCCKREVWEETGVKCSKVIISHSQPWPYPVNLMIGCIGIAEFNDHDEKIDLGNDPELRDARWFDFDDIKQVLERQIQNADDQKYLPDEKEVENKSLLINVPPKIAIAHILIDAVVNNRFPKL